MNLGRETRTNNRRYDPKEENAHVLLCTKKTARRILFDDGGHRIKLLPRQVGSVYLCWPVNAHCTQYLLLEYMHLPGALTFCCPPIFLLPFTQKYFRNYLL